MRTTCCAVWLLLATIMAAEAAPDPVSQAWAVRIDGPTNTPIQAAGMDVGPSGDVFLAGNVRGAAYYIHDILITRRKFTGALIWERRYEPPEGPSASEFASGG